MKFASLIPELPSRYSKLTQQQRARVRQAYVDQQKGKCWHCKESLAQEPSKKPSINWRLFPRGFLNHPVHLHHNHRTDLTIGAVHAYCNAVLWQYYGE